MESAVSARSRHARRLFAGIALSYEWVATVLSLGQDPRWREALAAAVCAKNEDRVLDVATGTGMVARALVRRYGCRVIGLDQSADMLAAGSADGRPLVRAQGERLPFADESFDHVTFTYLLRNVDDPAATIRELARVLRPGGRVATLEFGVPAHLGIAAAVAGGRADERWRTWRTLAIAGSPSACWSGDARAIQPEKTRVSVVKKQRFQPDAPVLDGLLLVDWPVGRAIWHGSEYP